MKYTTYTLKTDTQIHQEAIEALHAYKWGWKNNPYNVGVMPTDEEFIAEIEANYHVADLQRKAKFEKLMSRPEIRQLAELREMAELAKTEAELHEISNRIEAVFEEADRIDNKLQGAYWKAHNVIASRLGKGESLVKAMMDGMENAEIYANC